MARPDTDIADASADTSPQVYARVGGVLYLAIIAAGINGELFVRGSIVVSGDAAATARNLVGSSALWRAGLAGDLVMHLCNVAPGNEFLRRQLPAGRSWHVIGQMAE